MTAIPRLVIAGTESGCGKTSVASGLMSALKERGLVVQPLKTGPDFIDPTHHTRICGRTSRNLDPFMMGEVGVLQTFVTASAGADIAVVEGAMGLFDGIDGSDFSSTAHVARILNAPVVLVVSAAASARSVHAVVRGFRDFDPRVRIAGVIFNRLARAGAELRVFSPMDDTLPEMDALYLGGGYPELYADRLEASPCRDAIGRLADQGMPVYGECGGLMFLGRSITTDREYRMAGLLPACTEMTSRFQALGYVKGSFSGTVGFWAGGSNVLGHEFHFSRTECDPDARFSLHLEQGAGIRDGNDGLTEQNTVGMYTHAYFSDSFCEQFVAAAEAFRRNR